MTLSLFRWATRDLLGLFFKVHYTIAYTFFQTSRHCGFNEQYFWYLFVIDKAFARILLRFHWNFMQITIFQRFANLYLASIRWKWCHIKKSKYLWSSYPRAPSVCLLCLDFQRDDKQILVKQKSFLSFYRTSLHTRNEISGRQLLSY